MIKNSQPFGKNVGKPRGGGFFWFTLYINVEKPCEYTENLQLFTHEMLQRYEKQT